MALANPNLPQPQGDGQGISVHKDSASEFDGDEYFCAVSIGSIVQAAGSYIEDAVIGLHELNRADLAPGVGAVMVEFILCSWLRGQPNAFMPAPGEKSLADRIYLELRNVRPHIFTCTNRLMARRHDYDDGSVDFFPNHPRLWKVTWRKPGDVAAAMLKSIAAAVPLNIQTLLDLGPIELAKRESREIARREETAVHDKTGQAHPCIAEIQLAGDLPGVTSAIDTAEIQQGSAGEVSKPSSKSDGQQSSAAEIQQIAANSKSFESAAVVELSTAEALRLLKGNATAEQARSARLHIASLTASTKNDICRSLLYNANMKQLRQEVLKAIGSEASKNWGGKWTNAIKLDVSAVRRALDEVTAMAKEKRRVDSVGGCMMDLARRFSPLLAAWYPDEQ